MGGNGTDAAQQVGHNPFNGSGYYSVRRPLRGDNDFFANNPDGSRQSPSPFMADPNTKNRRPFPGNIMPPSLFDPAAAKEIDSAPCNPNGSAYLH